jgi:predicted acylesterase/phospholipase RssA
MPKTSFFKSCVGVFQGGGCRAAAFVGAYDEAVSSGVSFTEVSGTSAGSIVAALIGAGATPKELNHTIKTLDFRSFVGSPDRTAPRGFTGRIFGLKFPEYANLFYDQGFHSISSLRAWIEAELCKLLPNEKSPITFSSLTFPTYIVSTDLNRSEAKVWSQITTPNELVSDAVYASCAIPIFFQPVDRRHVDGGVLSNLPTFVFSDREHSQRILTSRILAFTLAANEAASQDWGTEQFLKLLANAIVDGSQQLQLSMQPNVHIVKITTGNVKATDFNKITPEVTEGLIQNGVDATRKFFASELLQVRPAISRDSVCYGSDELYTRTTETLDIKLDRVVIADHNTDWVYSLFPSILCWRARGVTVDVIIPELGDKADGLYRRKLLRAMGVYVTEMAGRTAVPTRSIITIPHDKAQIRAMIGVEKQSKSQTIDAVLYEGFLDASSIYAVLEQLDRIIETSTPPPSPRYVPKFEADGVDVLLSKIKSVGQYSKADVDVSIENVSIDSFVSLTRFVREYKYHQIRHLSQLYRQLGLPLFGPAIVQLDSGQSSIITPPVVEEAGGQYILIEGSTRAIFCRDEGVPQIKCVVVRGVKDPLPSVPVPFKQVRVVGRTLDTLHRYEQFNYAYFRSIERAVHSLDSLV